MSRLPTAWPARSPWSKRCSRARPSGRGRVGQGAQAPTEVPGRQDPQLVAEAAAGAAVVGDRDHRDHVVGPRRHRPEGGGQAVTTPHAGHAGHRCDVPVDQRGVATLLAEAAGDLLGHGHRPVVASRAAEGDAQVGPALLLVLRQEEVEHAADPVEEGIGGGVGEGVGPDVGVEAAEGAQLLVPVRVGQEAHVEDQVRVAGQAVLVAEGGDRQVEAVGHAGRDQLLDARPAARARSGPRCR